MKAADASSERLGMAATAFAITVAFELVDGAFPEFYQRVSENASLSVAVEPGCLRFDVLTPVEAGASPQVFLYEIYRDRAAFDFHLASEALPEFRPEDPAISSRRRRSGPMASRKTQRVSAA